MRLASRRALRGVLRVLAAGSLLAASGLSHALHTCSVGIGNMNFGTFTGVQQTSTSTLSVTCSLTIGVIDNVSFSVALSTGAGSYLQRVLTHVGPPADTLPYNLYLGTVPSILNTSVWGDGSGSTVTASGSQTLVIIFDPSRTTNFTVAGAMAAVPSLPTAGSYTDLIMATVTYN